MISFKIPVHCYSITLLRDVPLKKTEPDLPKNPDLSGSEVVRPEDMCNDWVNKDELMGIHINIFK